MKNIKFFVVIIITIILVIMLVNIKSLKYLVPTNIIFIPDRNSKNKIPLGNDNNYFKDDQGNVYWYHNIASIFPDKPYYQRIESADATTFRELSCGQPPWSNCDPEYGIDKNNVYREGKILNGIDPSTFKFVSINDCIHNQPCFQDKYHTYTFKLAKNGDEVFEPLD